MSYNNTGGFSNALNQPVIVQGQEVKEHAAQPYNQFSDPPLGAAAAPKPHVRERGCRDVFWALFFYAHLGGMGALTAIYAPQAVSDVASSINQQGGGGGGNNNRLLRQMARRLEDQANAAAEIAIDPHALVTIVAVAGVVGLVLSTLTLGLMISFADALIRMALIFNIVLFGALALLSLVGGVVGLGLLFGILCAFSAYYACCVWSRIPFAASNLVTAATAVKSNLGLAFYAYWSLVLMFLWSVWWSIGAFSTVSVLGDCAGGDECLSDVNGGIIFLLLLSFYWTTQVIANVVHVTTAGTVGQWWHAPHEASGCCSKAVRDSYFRSMTLSFGSICFGSLIVAIIQAVREMIHQARDGGDSLIACCAECLIGCIESLVEYFNKWAFVYVGLYNMSFMESGVQVMNLFRARGWTAIIADYMVDTVLFMVSVGVGTLTAVLALVVGATMGMGNDATLGVAFALGWILGYAMCATLLSVVSSAVATVIVCYAESPNEFNRNHPDLSRRMRDSWRQAWPSEFGY